MTIAASPALAIPDQKSRLIVDAKSYPWSAFGRVNTGGRGHCTGVLVSERHVLTEAQCLYNATEGRWWAPSELHFVAGYQRDSHLTHAPVHSYKVAPGYAAGTLTLSNLLNNFALLALEQPIGSRAGWLKIQWLDQRALAQLERGKAYPLNVGYRAGQAHVATLSFDCTLDSLLRQELISRGACKRLAAEVGLARMLVIDGEVRALAPKQLPKSFAGVNFPAIASFAQSQNLASLTRRRTGDAVRTLLNQIASTQGALIRQPKAGTAAALAKPATASAALLEKPEPLPIVPVVKPEPRTVRAAVTLEAALAVSEPSKPSVLIHLASLRSEGSAKVEAARLKKIHHKQLSALDIAIVRVDLGGQGTFYRLVADAGHSSKDARKLCGRLRDVNQYCAILAARAPTLDS